MNWRILYSAQLLLYINIEVASNPEIDHIFNVFQNCQFKFISIRSNNSSFNQIELFGKSSNSINKAHITLQLYNLLETRSFKFRNSSPSDSTKYSKACYVHAYIYDIYPFSALTPTFTFLERFFNELRKSGEWPHHTLFIKQSQLYSEVQSRQISNFYRTLLPKTFARGIILEINFHLNSSAIRNINLVCIHCKSSLQSLDLDQGASTKSLEDFRDSLEARGIYLITPLSYIQAIEHACDIASVHTLPTHVHRFSSVCVFHILQDHFNFTYFTDQTFDNTTELAYFDTKMSFFFEHDNYENMIKTRQREWIPYDVRRQEYQFVGFQQLPKITLVVFIRPYDWISWVIFFVLVLVLLVLRFVLINQNFMDTFELFLSLLAVFLEQPVKAKGLSAAKIESPLKYFKRTLFCCWMIWVPVMMVYSNGYKGILFSFLTTSLGVFWPESLEQLTKDRSYAMFSNEAIFDWDATKNDHVAVPMLDYYSKKGLLRTASNGNNIPPEYRILERSTVHANLSETMIIVEGIIQDDLLHRNKSYYKIGKVTSWKFAWLHRTPEEFSALLTNFLPELVASKPNKIPGFERITPWQISRSFLYESFVRSFAWLEQTGFLLAFKHFRNRWQLCNSVAAVEEKLAHSISNKDSLGWGRCINKILSKAFIIQGGGGFAGARPLNLEQCYGMFQVGFVLNTMAFVVFVLEMLKWFGNVSGYRDWISVKWKASTKIKLCISA